MINIYNCFVTIIIICWDYSNRTKQADGKDFNLCIRIFLFIIRFRKIERMSIHLCFVLLHLCLWEIAPMQFGSNLIVNGRFSSPDLIAANINLRWYNAPNFIPGWKCATNCELDNCRRQSPIYLNIKVLYGNCTQQVLDLSSNQIQTATQIFQADEGAHYLEVEFLIPFYFANKKTLLVYFNGENIYKFRPLVSQQFNSIRFNTTVQTIYGSNNISFTMSGLNDSYGFRLISVSVRKIIDTTIQNIIQGIFTNTILTNVISVPGSRVLLGQLVSTLVSFDRMQLYYYHNRNYSYYTTIFLKGITDLMNSKGEMSLKIQKKILGEVGEKQEGFISQLDYKQKYINSFVQSKYENGFGFIGNNSNLFVYSLPYFILFISVLYFAFHCTFNVKFSKILRKYSFLGIIIFQMLFEGNIEQFTFYICGQLTTFFSVNFRHKIVNTFIVLFFFPLCFYSMAIYFWCWRCYKKKIKYFTDNAEYRFEGILAYTISSGIMCMVFGAVHQLLLFSPNLQLLVLMGIEIIWIFLQLLMVGFNAFQAKMVTCLNVVQGLIRMSFQLSLLLFEKGIKSPSDASFINQSVHLRQIFLFIAVWGLQFMVSIFLCLRGYLNLLKFQRQNSLLTFKIRMRDSRFSKFRKRKNLKVGFKNAVSL